MWGRGDGEGDSVTKASRAKTATNTNEGIVKWAESRIPAHAEASASPRVPAPRHPPGRGSRMDDDEIHRVRLDFLCHSFNRVQLSAKYGRTRNTIARCLEGKPFEELRRQVDSEVRDVVRRRMVAKADDAVGHWERSMDVAADRGDHKPSKDWLMHAGVIDPIESTETGPKVVVQIGVSAEDVKIDVLMDGSSVSVGAADGDF